MKNRDRVSHQTARTGWKPKRTGNSKLSKDIVDSIRLHAEAGITRTATHYTDCEEVIEMVNAILAKGK